MRGCTVVVPRPQTAPETLAVAGKCPDADCCSTGAVVPSTDAVDHPLLLDMFLCSTVRVDPSGHRLGYHGMQQSCCALCDVVVQSSCGGAQVMYWMHSHVRITCGSGGLAVSQ